MSREALKLWHDELVSGDWEQGQLFLSKNGKYCCLGVACELYQREIGGLRVTSHIDGEDNLEYKKYNHQDGCIPTEVYRWLGLNVETQHLARLNDSGRCFKEIAGYIRDNYLR